MDTRRRGYDGWHGGAHFGGVWGRDGWGRVGVWAAGAGWNPFMVRLGPPGTSARLTANGFHRLSVNGFDRGSVNGFGRRSRDGRRRVRKRRSGRRVKRAAGIGSGLRGLHRKCTLSRDGRQPEAGEGRVAAGRGSRALAAGWIRRSASRAGGWTSGSRRRTGRPVRYQPAGLRTGRSKIREAPVGGGFASGRRFGRGSESIVGHQARFIKSGSAVRGSRFPGDRRRRGARNVDHRARSLSSRSKPPGLGSSATPGQG